MIKRGEIFYADLDPGIGSEQRGYRPVVVIQNDIGNEYSPTVIVAMITSRSKSKMPTHIRLSGDCTGLPSDSLIMLEQIRTIDKQRLGRKVGVVHWKTMKKMEKAALCSLGIRKRS